MVRVRSWVWLSVCLVAVACGRSGGGATDDAEEGGALRAAPAAEALHVGRGDARLVFRYYDGEARRMMTASSVEAVPEAARARVIVFDEGRLAAYQAGQPLTVADLRTVGPDGLYPSELVDPYAFEGSLPRRPAPAAPPASAPKPGGAATVAGVGADDVLLFSTEWCPHCRHARDFLKARGVRFTERDVEKDPKARPLLGELGKAAGVDPALLGSVPVLWVKGRLLLGFDEQAVARALGS